MRPSAANGGQEPNGIEAVGAESSRDTQRSAALAREREASLRPLSAAPARTPADNAVESDEVFTATGADMRGAVPASVAEKYVQKGSAFYYAQTPNVVAFEDRGNKLETRSNSEQVAETMVAIALARGWDESRCRGQRHSDGRPGSRPRRTACR